VAPAARKPARRRVSLKERARVEDIFQRFLAATDHPRTELNFNSPYTLTVAVALSAQATDVSVNKATEKLFALADTPAKMLELGEAGLIPYIASIGLFRTKAKNVIALSRIILEQHGGETPLNREDLDIEPAIAVDTHVFRVSHRLKLAFGKTPDAVEAELMAIVPAPYLTRAHHWLILHGRYVCVARKPRCEVCLISDLCPSRELFFGG
jgi:endonuclease-3